MRWLCGVFLMVAFLGQFESVHAAERFNLDIYASKFDSIPIAVLKFRPAEGSQELTDDLPWKIVANDLEFTGHFEVFRANRVDSAAFAEKNIGIFIDGEYRITDDRIVVDCYLHDATTMDLVLGKKYQGNLKFLRTMAHRYASELVEVLTGDRGVFESKIVFVRDKGKSKNLFIMDYDGHNVRQVTNMSTLNIFPAFADSSTLFWVSYLRGKPDLYKGSISSGASNIFMYGRFVTTSPAVSPIEGKVAFACSKDGNLEIYTMGVDKTGLKRLTHNKSIDTSPDWSPNGYELAFTSDRGGSPQIYLMDKDGANVRRITFEGRYQDSPSWSPKGDKIAYSSLVDGKFDIWTVEPDGSNPTRVTELAGSNQNPTWSPDASHIAFVNMRGGQSNICMIRPDGTDLKVITQTGDAKMPDWSRWF